MSGTRQLRVLDLFSGIGGFSLGLERTGGFRTVAFCEIEPYCRAVLGKHWPYVPCFEDVRQLHAYDVGPVDVICGGFPCQDISLAGKGAGLAGARSGLWNEYRRLIEECRPSWVVIENVSALRSRGLDQVLGEITALGYDAEWHCIPASAVGAPHRRDRVWIVAHADQFGAYRAGPCDEGRDQPSHRSGALAYPGRERDEPRRVSGIGAGATSEVQGEVGQQRLRIALTNGGQDVADAISERGRGWHAEREDAEDAGQSPGHPRSRSWDVEPDVGRVANGVPSRVDRLRALGNAVVPQIPEIIGRAIIEAENLMAGHIYLGASVEKEHD